MTERKHSSHSGDFSKDADKAPLERPLPAKSPARASLGSSPGASLAAPRPFDTHLRDGTSSPISPALSLRLQQVTGTQAASTNSSKLEEGERATAGIRRDRVRPSTTAMSRAASHQQQHSDAAADVAQDASFGIQKSDATDGARHGRQLSEPNISPRLAFKSTALPENDFVTPEWARWEERSPELKSEELSRPLPLHSRQSSIALPPVISEQEAQPKRDSVQMEKPGHARQDSVSTIGRNNDSPIEPESLRSISISLITSSIATGEVILTIGIFRKDMRLLHRLEKTYDQLVSLKKSTPDMGLALPTRADFVATSSMKADARRATTDLWFQMMVSTLVSTPVQQRIPEFCQGLDAFCAFLSSDRIEEVPKTPRRARQSQQLAVLEPTAIVPAEAEAFKEGYLSKRGKAFGGWKSRYFMIDGPCMRYFDAPGGALLGEISLAGAQVGVQTSSGAQSSDDSASHAFLILEQKRKGVGTDYQRHILCANSDMERDAWLKVLMHYAIRFTEALPQPPSTPAQLPTSASQRLSGLKISGPLELQQGNSGAIHKNGAEEGDFRAIGYRETAAAGPPLTPSFPLSHGSESVGGTPYEELYHASITAEQSETWASPGSSKSSQAAKQDARKAKKKPFWAFGKHGEQPSPQQAQAASLAAMREAASNAYNAPGPDFKVSASAGSGTLFGMPLAEAVALSSPPFARIPSIVYRCLQYLDERHVEREEGIYRLSGSSSLIKALRERFNQEIDIDLLSGTTYDVHAVAGMLKLYLRELPSPILTRDLQRDFLELIEMPDEPARMATIKTLVHALPRENFELLQVLTRHLHGIVEHEPVNKMSLRNVGIVFSPTLNIPASVFCLFIDEHEGIFGEAHLASTSNASASILAGYLQEAFDERDSST